MIRSHGRSDRRSMRCRAGLLAHTGVNFVRARVDGIEQVPRFVLLP